MSDDKFDQLGILQTEIRQRDNMNTHQDELYKNLNFLQKEKRRLEKLQKLVYEKVELLQAHSQIPLLSVQEEESTEELKDQIVAHSVPIDSNINRKLKAIFQQE